MWTGGKKTNLGLSKYKQLRQGQKSLDCKKTSGHDVLYVQRMLSVLPHSFKGKDKGICRLCAVHDWVDLANMQSGA